VLRPKDSADLPDDLVPASQFEWWRQNDCRDEQWSPSHRHYLASLFPAADPIDLTQVPASRISLKLSLHPDIPKAIQSAGCVIRISESVERADIELLNGSNWDLQISQNSSKVGQAAAPMQTLRLEINSDWASAQILDIPAKTHLVLHQTTVDLVDCVGSEIEIYGGKLTINEVQVGSIAAYDTQEIIIHRSFVELLKVVEGSELLVKVSGDSSIGQVAKLSDGSHNSRPDLTLIGDSNLRVERVRLSSLCIGQTAQVSALDDIGPISISGPGAVEVDRTVHGLTFVEPAPRLFMRPYSQMINAAGPFTLRYGPHARLAGRADGGSSSRDRLELRDIDADPGGLTGVSLVNFSVPVSLQGIQMLNVIRDNAILATPLLHDDLPGMHDTVKSQIAKRQLRRREVEAIEMDYASAISSLSHIGNSPASVRTKLAWCAYRVRHLQTTGPERFILGAYRLIGYGERPMPAFILYFVFALFVTIVYLSDESLALTAAGIGNFLTILFGWLVSPLHLLNLTGEKEGTVSFIQPWDTLARLLIAAPFATGLLALRKYVKDEKPG
jgi:hypothetical protein